MPTGALSPEGIAERAFRNGIPEALDQVEFPTAPVRGHLVECIRVMDHWTWIPNMRWKEGGGF